MARDRPGVACAFHEPASRGRGVGLRLQRCEALGRDDEQRGRRIEAGERPGRGVAVDVGEESDLGVAVGLEGLADQLRPQVRAADSDVYHRADNLAGVPAPAATPDILGEREEAIALRLDEPGDSLGGLALRCAQGRVQCGPVFGRIDVLAIEERLDGVVEAAFLG